MTEHINAISSYSGILPVIAGVFLVKGHSFWPFICFLITGILNDLFQTYSTNDILANLAMSVYSLFDILFLLWFTTQLFHIKMKWQIAIGTLVFTLWFIAYKMHVPLQANYSEGSRFFDPIFLTITSILAAIGLLKIIESPLRLEYNQYFGFYLGIFFYNFSVFFTHIFLSDDIAKEIWYLNALFNITTMLIYTWAFLRLRGPQRS